MSRFRLAGLVVAVILFVGACYELVVDYPFLGRKLSGKAPHCSWWNTLCGTRRIERFAEFIKSVRLTVRERAREPELDIVLVESLEKDFWVRRTGQQRAGPELVAYLLAEHRWLEELDPDLRVRPGEVVLDCCAHVGVVTHAALSRGAARVISVEPDPVNQECLRRNFEREIAAGRVVVLKKAVWDREGTLEFQRSEQNLGANTAVMTQSGDKIQVSATTIDRIAEEYGRIDYIKMDIEGSERKALAGARNTLHRYKPRLAIEANHLPDDGRVLPSLILQGNPDYSITCGPCEIIDATVVPYIYYGR